MAKKQSWTREDLQLLHRTDYPHLSDDDFAYFMQVHRERALNPWLRLLWPEYVYSEQRRQHELKLITTVKALQIIAGNTGLYEGPLQINWCGPDGAWRESWADKALPLAAIAGVRRAGFTQPVFAVAHFDEYAQMNPDRDGRMMPTDFWTRMGKRMIGKCAMALALRDAFPESCAELLLPEEIAHQLGERRVRELKSGAMVPTDGSKLGWNPDQPQSAFQLGLALVDLGYQDLARRNRFIAECRQASGELSERDPAEFYAFVVKSAREAQQVREAVTN